MSFFLVQPSSSSSAPDTSSSSASPLPRHGAEVLKRHIAAADREVVKRDGSRVRYDQNKITRAVALAFREVHAEDQDNPYRDDMLACFGLDSDRFIEATKIAGAVSQILELHYRNGVHPTIEQVQDAVEKAIAAAALLEARLEVTREPFMSEEKFVQNIVAVALDESKGVLATGRR